MPEVLFYQLSRRPLEAALPEILSRALHRGWKTVVRARTPATLGLLDDLLWTYDAGSFLPHGTDRPDQPIYLTCDPRLHTPPDVLILVDGSRVDPGEAAPLPRTCLFFHGADEAELSAAREDWLKVKTAGLAGTYWADGPNGWQKKAES